MRARSELAITVVLAALAACTTTGVDEARLNPARVVVANLDERARSSLAVEPHLELRGGEGLEPGGAEWMRTAIRNALYVDYYRTRESRYYPSSKRAATATGDADWPAGLPRRCIALSGGGMRSAAFSMGALDALHASGWLGEVDVISSSSGGSYANYWLTMALATGKSRDEIFSGSASPALQGVRRNAHALAQPWWVLAPASAAAEWVLLATTLQAPRSLDRALSRGIQQDLFQHYTGTVLYAGVLNRMFGPSADTKRMTVTQLRAALAAAAAPVPVINATARVGAFKACSEDSREGLLDVRGVDLETSVFELTPWRIGSGGIGYAAPHDRLQLSLALASSAAAVDDPNTERCPFTGVAELRLGMFNTGYRAASDQVQTEHDDPEPGPRVHVTLVDAAFSDNLAVFPLVRRVCREILVIDAEHDPILDFESYAYLRQHLRAMGIELDMPGIDALTARHLEDYSASPGGCACRGHICLIESREACLRYGATNDCQRPFRLPDPVFRGVIRDIPFVDHAAAGTDGAPRSLMPRITYLKLSLDEDRLQAYPGHVRDRFQQQAALRADGRAVCTGETFDERCSFPHESTYDQNFGDGQFEAYWELGHCAVERHLGSGGADAQCRDEAWPALPPEPKRKIR